MKNTEEVKKRKVGDFIIATCKRQQCQQELVQKSELKNLT